MFIFENIIIMFSSPIMTCFVQYSTLTVYHILRLDNSMFLPFSRVIALPSPFVLWSWYLLFGSINKGLESWKVLSYFVNGSKPSCTFIQLLWQWNRQFDK